MTFEYIDAAMKAAGLSAPQKAVLLNYSIRADQHGYAYPGRKRIADDTGLALRTVDYAKRQLIAKELIVNLARHDEKTGRQITDLVRIDLARVQAAARPKRDYNDNLIEELIPLKPLEEPQAARGAPDAPPSEGGCTSCTPEDAQDAGGGCTTCILGGARGATLESSEEPPGESSSSKKGAVPSPREETAPRAEAKTDDENASLNNTDSSTDGDAADFVADLPGVKGRDIADLTRPVAAALEQGWQRGDLRRYLVERCDLDKVKSPRAVYARNLQGIGAPPQRSSGGGKKLPPACPDHGFDHGPAEEAPLPWRTRETEDGTTYKCPDCHPYASSYRGPGSSVA